MNNQTESDDILTKNSPNTGTCYGKNINNFIPGFAKQFQDSFFYANIIQFLLVVLMYYKAGHGRYWKILFYAAIAGCIGSVLENATVAFICLPRQIDNNSIVVPFLIDELFWTSQQYSVPLLNLIKMKTLVTKRVAKIMKVVIFIFFLIFFMLRLAIGVERMLKGYLVDHLINVLHGFAFGTIAMADLICTVSILYFIRNQNNQNNRTSYTLTQQVKSSSYTILICVDVVEFFLSIFDIFANIGIAEDYIPAAVATPFQCLMSNFILILAVDALLLKYKTFTDSGSYYANKEGSSEMTSVSIEKSYPVVPKVVTENSKNSNYRFYFEQSNLNNSLTMNDQI